MWIEKYRVSECSFAPHVDACAMYILRASLQSSATSAARQSFVPSACSHHTSQRQDTTALRKEKVKTSHPSLLASRHDLPLPSVDQTPSFDQTPSLAPQSYYTQYPIPLCILLCPDQGPGERACRLTRYTQAFSIPCTISGPPLVDQTLSLPPQCYHALGCNTIRGGPRCFCPVRWDATWAYNLCQDASVLSDVIPQSASRCSAQRPPNAQTPRARRVRCVAVVDRPGDAQAEAGGRGKRKRGWDGRFESWCPGGVGNLEASTAREDSEGTM